MTERTPDAATPAAVTLADAATAAAPRSLEALAARGARRVDPVRWHLATGLARRAPAHAGEARRVIEARLAALVDELAAALDAVPAERGRADAPAASPRASRTGPLAALAAQAGARPRAHSRAPTSLAPAAAPSRAPAPRPAARGAPTPASAPPAEPPGLHYFRRTWSRLNARERLAQSCASLPANAGPLNSHILVHRALATLHELAPGYLEHLVAHVDDLLWIEAATGGAGPEAPAPARGDAERKAPRGR
jgi:hypothetical protein